MTNDKYKLIKSDKKSWDGQELFQVVALKDFGSVSKGDKGGYIQAEANLSVSGNAWVYGNARVYGNAWVYGDARVYGDAWVYGDARVYGDACVSGDARVYGNACVYGDACVSGDARVYGDAWVSGDAWVYGNARVYGNASVSGDAWVYGNARVYGNASVYGKLKLEAGFFFGVKWSGEKIQEIEIENGNYLIYKGDAKFGTDEPEIDDATAQAMKLLQENGYKIVKDSK